MLYGSPAKYLTVFCKEASSAAMRDNLSVTPRIGKVRPAEDNELRLHERAHVSVRTRACPPPRIAFAR